nr:immunoglobulin light chain junction region [Macaca mulatta]
CQENTGFPSTF